MTAKQTNAIRLLLSKFFIALGQAIAPKDTSSQDPPAPTLPSGFDLAPALAIIKKYEGCVLEAYWDSLGRVWTIGWGHTAGIKRGMKITQAQADQYLASDVASFAAGVKADVKVPITDNQLCALTSFAYNLGLRALYYSPLLKLLNSGAKPEDVAAKMPDYDHAGGQVRQNLLERRRDEATLFLEPEQKGAA